MQALVKCFKEKLGKTVLIYERNTPSKAGQVHCHLQVVPVPEEKEDTIGEHVLECGRQSNIEFEPNPRWRDEEDLEHYVVYDVPSKKSTYLHKIPQVCTCVLVLSGLSARVHGIPALPRNCSMRPAFFAHGPPSITQQWKDGVSSSR
jgi:hypothetical protein